VMRRAATRGQHQNTRRRQSLAAGERRCGCSNSPTRAARAAATRGANIQQSRRHVVVPTEEERTTPATARSRSGKTAGSNRSREPASTTPGRTPRASERLWFHLFDEASRAQPASSTHRAIEDAENERRDTG